MRIIVPIKQVPETEELRYDPATRTLVREGVTSIINPFDKRALTEANRLRSLYGGEIKAITMGPPQARDALVECLGRGVDRAIHISDRALAGSDTLVTARVLAAAVRRIPFDLILAGKWTTDSETGQVGPELAEMLDLPQVTGATSIELVGDNTLKVTRETDTGFEQLTCPLPALLTAAERLIKPTKTKPPVIEEGIRRITEDPSLIETLTIRDLGLELAEVGLSGSPTWVVELRPVEVKRERIVLSGSDPDSLAASLLAALRERGLHAERSAARPTARPLPPPVEDPDPHRSVWVVAESLRDEASGVPRLRPLSFELAGEAARIASRIGGEAVAVLMGSGVEPLADPLAQYGASTVLLADNPALENYTAEIYAWVLARAIERYRPWAVLLPATSFGSDLAPRVAARLGLGLTGDCLGVEPDGDGRLLQLKPAFGGQVVAPIASRTLPNMATIRPGMLAHYEPGETRSAQVVRLDVEGLPNSRVKVEAVTHEGLQGLSLDDAHLLVCVGMGIGGPESLEEVGRLASTLGDWMGLPPERVAVGGTRKVVDEGWLPRHQQVGITGRAVAPHLYLGLGISGTFNHIAGIMRSRTIVAVNSDTDAPIFEAADIGVVTEWQSFTHALMRRLARPGG